MSIPYLTIIVMSWRNLWRNPRRSGIMLAAICIGVWAMIFMTALMRGMVEDMLKRGIDNLPGYVQIHHPDYLDDPSIVNSMKAPADELLEKLNSPKIELWYSRIKVPAVIASERETRGILLHGIDPEREANTILRNATITEGKFLASDTDSGLVIGRKLLDRLETDVGKRVVVMSQTPDNTIAERGFRIVGVYQSDLSAQEDMNVFIARKVSQKLLGMEGFVSEVAVFGAAVYGVGTRDVEPLLSEFETVIGNEEKIKAESWNTIQPYLSSMVGMMDGFVLVWVIVIFLAMSFGLANTFVMAIYERIREIGLMMSLGMHPAMMMIQVLIESVFLLLMGLVAGNALAFVSLHALKGGIDLSSMAEGLEMAGVGTELYPALFMSDVLTANVVVCVLGVLTCIYPAWRASRFDPIKALNKPT
ncbi:MAG: ABC transporter permease [Agarilytica sp.]